MSTTTHKRVALRLMMGEPGAATEWMQAIWEANKVCEEQDIPVLFGKPEIEPWWAGGEVEEYPDARVIHRLDPSVSIVSKTPHGAAVLRVVAQRLKINVSEG